MSCVGLLLFVAWFSSRSGIFSLAKLSSTRSIILGFKHDPFGVGQVFFLGNRHYFNSLPCLCYNLDIMIDNICQSIRKLLPLAFPSFWLIINLHSEPGKEHFHLHTNCSSPSLDCSVSDLNATEYRVVPKNCSGPSLYCIQPCLKCFQAAQAF